MITLRRFIRQNEIKFAYKVADANPAMGENMDHWRCRLRIGDRKIIVPFSKGYGHRGRPPSLREVLACLASDSHNLNGSFNDWADEYGYAPDSRTAHRTYKACCKIAEKLEYLLGGRAALEDLIYNVDMNGDKMSGDKMSVKMRIEVERKIVGKFVQDALAAGYRLAVSLERGYDAPDCLLGSVDYDKIMDEAFAGDDCHIFIQPGDGPLTDEDGRIVSDGWVNPVFGNDGWDVISDYSANELTERLLVGANAISDQYA
jgi:hypothetical protein